jgi:hypothetical protein
MQDKWLKCEVGPGMFSDEYVVTIKLGIELMSETSVCSRFVAKEFVKHELHNAVGLLRVRAFQQNAKWWAVLPTEDQEAILVGDSDLTSS